MPYLIQGITYDDNALGGAPYLHNGAVFVPLKGVTELLGGEVDFDGNHTSNGAIATVTLNGVMASFTSSQGDVQLTQGSTTTNITLLADPIGQDVHMFVPSQFFQQAYGIPVVHNDATNTARIS